MFSSSLSPFICFPLFRGCNGHRCAIALSAIFRAQELAAEIEELRGDLADYNMVGVGILGQNLSH